MNIDTECRHITKAGTNIFLDLGFDAEEAEQLYAESQRQINETLVLKEQLMNELTKWIAENHFKQAQVAEILNVSRPQVSALVNNKVSQFTFETLLNMLGKVGKKVSVAIS